MVNSKVVRDLVKFVDENRTCLSPFTFTNCNITWDIASTLSEFPEFSINLMEGNDYPYLNIVFGDKLVNIDIDQDNIPEVDDEIISLLKIYNAHLEDLKKRVAA